MVTFDLQVLGQGILDALGDAVDLLPVAPSVRFDDSNVGLVDGDDEIIGALREQVLHHIHRCNVRRLHLAHQENRPLSL